MGCGPSAPKPKPPAPAASARPSSSSIPSDEEVDTLSPLPSDRRPKKARVQPPAAVDRRPLLVFLLGGPGSDKEQHIAAITRDFAFTHLSVGELLRAEVAKATDLGKACKKLMSEDKLLSAELTLQLLKEGIREAPTARVLIEGFPRGLEEARVAEAGLPPAELLLLLDAPLSAALERRTGRRPSQEEAGSAEEVTERHAAFEAAAEPVAAVYEQRQRLVRVRAGGPQDAAYAQISRALKERLADAAAARREAGGGLSTLVLALGVAGSGKERVCAKAAARAGFTHLDAGELLRAEVDAGSELGLRAERLIRAGKLLPAEITLDLLRAAILEGDEPPERVLLEGFPKSLEQAEALEQAVGPVSLVLKFEASLELLGRRATDAGPDALARRHAAHAGAAGPLVEFYGAAGRVARIDLESEEAALARVLNALEDL